MLGGWGVACLASSASGEGQDRTEEVHPAWVDIMPSPFCPCSLHLRPQSLLALYPTQLAGLSSHRHEELVGQALERVDGRCGHASNIIDEFVNIHFRETLERRSRHRTRNGQT